MLGPNEVVGKLRREVVDALKKRFVGRDEVIDLIALAAVAGEHLFLYGPPGTAKSALIHQFATAVRGRYFEYLLTRFSEPNEIFGPIDLIRLREGTVATVTTGMLPEAEFVFLDELFNANSAILNNLLTVLNERLYRRGAETHSLPMLSLFSASNRLPDDDALHALFDRFLLRCHVDHLPREAMPSLLTAGWALERASLLEAAVSADDLRAFLRSLWSGRLRGARTLCRARIQGAGSGSGIFRSPRSQDAEGPGRLRSAVRAPRCVALRPLGNEVRVGPRRANQAACDVGQWPPQGTASGAMPTHWLPYRAAGRRGAYSPTGSNRTGTECRQAEPHRPARLRERHHGSGRSGRLGFRTRPVVNTC